MNNHAFQSRQDAATKKASMVPIEVAPIKGELRGFTVATVVWLIFCE